MSYHAYADGSGGYFQQSSHPQGIQGYQTSYMAPPSHQQQQSLVMPPHQQVLLVHDSYSPNPGPGSGGAKQYSAKKGPENLSRDGKSWKLMPAGLPPPDEALEENREKLMRLKMDAMAVREANRQKISSAPKAPPPAKAFVAGSSNSPISPASSQSQQRGVPSSRERVRQYSHHIAPLWQPALKMGGGARDDLNGGSRSSFDPQNGLGYDDGASSVGYGAPSESLYEEGNSPLDSPLHAHRSGHVGQREADASVPVSPSKSMKWSADGLETEPNSASPSPFPYKRKSQDLEEQEDMVQGENIPSPVIRAQSKVESPEAPPPPSPARPPAPVPAPAPIPAPAPVPVKKSEPVKPVKVDALLTLAETSKSKEAQDKAARLKAIASMLEELE